MIRTAIFAIAVGALALTVSACNTVKGMGKDIQSAGQAGDDAIHGKK
jgi:predicted small secreted protein